MSHFRAVLSAVALPALACSVPDLRIEERASVKARDAAAADSGTSEQPDAGSEDTPPARDSGTGQPQGAGSAAQSNGGRSRNAALSGGAQAVRGAAAVAGSSGQAGTPLPAAGAAGAPQPMQEPRACLVWTSTNIRNGPPPGALEGGFESIAGVTTRQYICRIRPAGSTYAIPGKYVDRVGCYIAQRAGDEVNDVSVLDGLIDVLVPAPGCNFSWRAASPTELPPGAVDLGDPADGRNYACRGNYMNLGASGTQIGAIIASTDTPPVDQCWFESFGNAIQPMEPTKFEVLVLDPP